MTQTQKRSPQELLEQSASVIRTLSKANEELKKENARLLREKHASELASTMVDSGVLDPDNRATKVAELMKVSEEDFNTLQKAVSMLGNAPNLGRIVDSDDDDVDLSDKGALYKVLYDRATGKG